MARGVPERNVGLSSCFVLEQDAFQVKQNGFDSQPQKRTLASWMWFPVLQFFRFNSSDFIGSRSLQRQRASISRASPTCIQKKTASEDLEESSLARTCPDDAWCHSRVKKMEPPQSGRLHLRFPQLTRIAKLSEISGSARVGESILIKRASLD